MEHKAAKARSRLDELTFATFNVRTSVVNGFNGIDHIDTLLRLCAAKSCDAIGLQETKRDETSITVISGYHVYFSGDCSEIKGRKRQHRVGLAIKEEIVKKVGKDGIVIEGISARLLRDQVSLRLL